MNPVTLQHKDLVGTTVEVHNELIAATNTLRELTKKINDRVHESLSLCTVRAGELEVYGHLPSLGTNQLLVEQLYRLAMSGQQRHLDDIVESTKNVRTLIDTVDKLLEINQKLIDGSKASIDGV